MIMYPLNKYIKTLLTFTAIGLSSFSYGKETYTIEVSNRLQQVVQTITYSYDNKLHSIENVHVKNYGINYNGSEIKYVDLCLKNGNSVQYTYKTLPFQSYYQQLHLNNEPANTGLFLSYSEPIVSIEPALTLDIVVPYMKSTDIGDCFIETLKLYHFKVTTNLPFILYEKQYRIYDDMGEQLEQLYKIKISKLINDKQKIKNND